jgi:hypothetical protein
LTTLSSKTPKPVSSIAICRQVDRRLEAGHDHRADDAVHRGLVELTEGLGGSQAGLRSAVAGPATTDTSLTA